MGSGGYIEPLEKVTLHVTFKTITNGQRVSDIVTYKDGQTGGRRTS